MDTTLSGFLTNINYMSYDKTNIIEFNLSDLGKNSILKNLPCYICSAKNLSEVSSKIDTSKEYCVEGCICSDERGINFQVHNLYIKPEKIL